jgi:hypothetical protein
MAFGYVEDGKVFRKGFAGLADKAIGEVNSTEEEALTYFTERFQKLQEEVDEIAAKINTEANKGSFLTKVEFLKDSLPVYDGIGDFEKIDAQLQQMIEGLKAYVEQNRHKNLQIKTALLEQLKPIATSHEWKTASAQVKEIQQKWIKTGAVAADKKEAIEGEFKALIDDFYKRRDDFYADLNKMMAEKEADFEDFLKAAQQKLAEKNLGKLRKITKELQEEWKSLGKLKPDRHSHFWNQYQEMIKKALSAAKASEKKITGANSKEQLASLKDFSKKLSVAAEKFEENKEIDLLRKEWNALQKIKIKEAVAIKRDIRFHMDVLAERNFLISLVAKKAKKDKVDFKFYSKVCRDLLERDKRELVNFEENMAKFNMASGLDNMLTKKLRQQQQKVDVKKTILEQIKSKMG